MFAQALSNWIVRLMISKKNLQQLLKQARMLLWILSRFDISQNEFEMKYDFR